MKGSPPLGVAKFETRKLARSAIRLDGLGRRWQAERRAGVWIIASPGRRAIWSDLPRTWTGAVDAADERSAVELTVESMGEMTKLAFRWAGVGRERARIEPAERGQLFAWVRLRQQAYDDGAELNREGRLGELWDRESMVERIAIDLEIEEADAERLCDLAGWLEPTIAAGPPTEGGS